MTARDIVEAVEGACPLDAQQAWDNSGWQVGAPSAPCSGALLCVDVTEQVIDEAVERGCNLVISHHPLLFRATRSIIVGDDRVDRCVARAFEKGVSIYSAHTSCDCSPAGVSFEMGRMLGLGDMRVLDTDSGLGVIGCFDCPLPWREVLDRVKEVFDVPMLRCSAPPTESHTVRCIALCGGAGADLLPLSYEKGASMLVTADCKFNTFLDVGSRATMLVDAGHFETEQCTKEIFYRAIKEKFPNFAVYKSAWERNPVRYY